MPKLWLMSIFIIALALFSPLFFLPREDMPPEPKPIESAPSTPLTLPEAKSDGEAMLTVLTADGLSTMSMAEYIPHAVAAEMPASFNEEALKAQSVAIRSYAMRMCLHDNPNHPQADICASPACCEGYITDAEMREKWGEAYEDMLFKISSACRATDGEYLAYEGEVIQAVFHAASEGATEASGSIWSELPYLVSVESPESAESVPALVTSGEFTPEEFRAAVLSVYPGASLDTATPEGWLGGIERTESGRVKSLKLGDITITGNEARQIFLLRSTDFDLVFEGGEFKFTVRGYGHGVGMSQQGANILAGQGYSYREILLHYYQGAEVKTPI